MAGGGVSCMKYIVFMCSLLFAITGLLLLLIGSLVQAKYYHYYNFVGENVWTAPIILIIVGIVVFIIGFLGCCGAFKENSCMVLVFSIFVLIIFLFEIGVGIAGYVKHCELKGILETGFNTTMQKYNDRKDCRDAWDLIQVELNCCGTHGPEDWAPYFPNSDILPKTCCSAMPLDSDGQCRLEHNHHKNGCLDQLLNLLDKNILILAGVVIAVSVVQLLTIVFACCLFRSFHMNYQTV